MATPRVSPEEITEFRRGFRTLILATSDPGGEALCSYAPFIQHGGQLYVFVSRLARHTSNLLERGEAHVLLIEDEKDAANPFARRRLTLRCRAGAVARDSDQGSDLLDRFEETFGAFFRTLRGLGDFQLVRLAPYSGNFVKGFGQAFELGGEELREIRHLDPARVRSPATGPTQILEFWFSAHTRKRWFRSTPSFDRQIREQFEDTWRAARDGNLSHWESTPQGALALVIVLDQFPLNMFRDRPEAFSTGTLARDAAHRAIERGLDADLDDGQKGFLYIPFMHSEVLADQDRAVTLYNDAGIRDGLKWASHHRDIIRRFGRFPHRNEVLGRTSTAEETAWLESSEAFRG